MVGVMQRTHGLLNDQLLSRMHRTRQHVYASNLLRLEPHLGGYPLLNPSPKEKSDLEGIQVGDVGYVDGDGRFNWKFNIRFPPGELQNQIQSFDLALPAGEVVFKPRKVIITGVNRILDGSRYFHITVDVPQFLLSGTLRADYAFNITSNEGAILILPDGASRWELDKAQVDELEAHVKKYALQICRFAREDTLYLVTGVVKSKSWTLGSFHNGSDGRKILVHRCSSGGDSNGGTDPFMYDWVCEVNVDDQEGPRNNNYVNQAVLIKGFRMTVKEGLFPSAELGGWGDSWFARVLGSVYSTLLGRPWVTRASKSYSDVEEHLSTRIVYSRRTQPISE